LYNWYAVATGKLCPAGWRVASDEDFKELEMFLGLSADEAAQTHWRGTDQGMRLKHSTGWSAGGNGNNNSGFGGLPGGHFLESNNFYAGLLSEGFWWTSSEQSTDMAWVRHLNSNQAGIFRGFNHKLSGFSVRCIKN
jgi:uncharacterized protein (TIGR02145 family)